MKANIALLACIMLTSIASAQSVNTFAVTDVRDQTVELTSLKIDYTQYSTWYTRDWEYDAIRVKQGAGTVNVKWSTVRELRLLEPGKPAMTAEIVLRSGKPLTMELVEDSVGGLVGDSALGEFKLRLKDVKSILVTPTSQKRPAK